MSRGGIPLAPPGRRLLAFSADLLFIGALVGVTYCMPGMPAYGTDAFWWMAWALFFAYHVTVLVVPDIGIGRLLTGIAVVSAATAARPGLRQALGRPVARTALAVQGAMLYEEWGFGIYLLAPVVLELGCIVFHPLRKTLADIAAGTVVIAVPPAQPHRAPAVPMYSRNDGEFGPTRRPDDTD